VLEREQGAQDGYFNEITAVGPKIQIKPALAFMLLALVAIKLGMSVKPKISIQYNVKNKTKTLILIKIF
jgi:hypothetical protein